MPDDPSPMANEAAPWERFEEIVDDSFSRQQASEWAFKQLSEGQDALSVIAELETAGWARLSATDIVEGCGEQSERKMTAVARSRARWRDARPASRVSLPLFLGGGIPALVLTGAHYLIRGLTWWLSRETLTHKRIRAGLCHECGYDIRASQERCPECGARIFPASRFRRGS